MQVAIFSDVHGNATALQAVLANIERRRPDYIVFAGDLCVFGARPATTVGLLREHRHILRLRGNTDEMLVHSPVVSDDAAGRQRDHLRFKRDSTLWAKDQLGQDDLRWLARMPFAHRLSPTAKMQDDLLVVHANPKDVHRFLIPPVAEQERRLGSVQFEQTQEELDALLENVEAGIVAFGHFHFPNVQVWRSLLLANISSVSNPMDGDPHAKYGLFTWDAADGWQVDLVRVEYDIKREQAALAEQKPHKWKNLSRALDGELFLG
jgi:predicted phosphodiesterase